MRRVPVLLATGAIALSLLAVVGAFTIPAYSTDTTSSDAGASTGSATLVEMNGWLPVWYLGGVAVLAAVCWLALHRRCAAGSRLGTVLAWICCLLVLALSLISVLGLFTLPIALMMLAALGTTPSGARAQRA
jgi:hypothetical protein